METTNLTSKREIFELSLSNKIPQYLKRKKKIERIRFIIALSLLINVVFMLYYSAMLYFDIAKSNYLTNDIFICSSLVDAVLILAYFLIE